MNKAPLHKHVKFVAKKSAKKMGVLQAVRSISCENILKKSQRLYFMGSYRQSPLISFSTWTCLLQWSNRFGTGFIGIEC